MSQNRNKIYSVSRSIAAFFMLLSVFAMPVHAQSALGISNVQTKVSGITIVISWQTNTPATARIDYGITDTYGLFIEANYTGRTDHEITLTNLQSNTTYHFSASSRVADQRVSTFDRTFKTAKTTDRNMPAISNVSIAYVTGTSATIQWETDEPTTSIVKYGKTSKYTSSAGNSAKVKIHDVTLKNLKIASTYHFQIQSTDKDGNTAYYSDLIFSTLLTGEGEKQSLEISNIRPITPIDVYISRDVITVSWKTNKLADGTVSYGASDKLGKSVKQPSPRSFDHKINIMKLKPATKYFFKITSKDVFGKSITSDLFTVKTRALYVAQSPQTPRVLSYSTLDYSQPSVFVCVQGGNDVFAIVNGQRYFLPAGKASLGRYGAQESEIITVSSASLDRYPPAQLVKSTISPRIYFLYRRQNNQFIKLFIASPEIFSSYPKNDWKNVISVDQSDIDAFPSARFVKTPERPEIYLLEGSNRRHISSMQVFVQRGYKLTDVVEVSQKHLDSFAVGVSINK